MKKYLLFIIYHLPPLILSAQETNTKRGDSILKTIEMDTVVFSTGFEKIPRERVTGSFTQIDNKLLNRKIGTDILSRLDGVTSGLLFNPTTDPSTIANQSSITIRGRSTLFANPNPLIILDNFPYDGDISTINPNDIENITILKDAAASSIWGARSSNGVIVITTKKGKRDKPLQVSLISNFSVAQKPQVYYQPRLDGGNYIELEQYFFENQQYFDGNLTGYSPVVDLLFKYQQGQLALNELDATLNAFKNQDVRNDLKRFVYQQTRRQQYGVQLQGGSMQHDYFISAGFDHNAGPLIHTNYSRVTLTARNDFHLLNSRLNISNTLMWNQSKERINSAPSSSRIYEKLIDDDGNWLRIQNNYRFSYIDTVGQDQLADWSYKPLEELMLADNQSILTDYRINTSINYQLAKGVKVDVLYQYSAGGQRQDNYRSERSYFVRDLYNQYAQLQYHSTIPTVTPVIPLIGILDQYSRNYTSHQLRGQLQYNYIINGLHEITGLLGSEIRDFQSQVRTNRLYGYDKDLQTSALLNYAIMYPLRPFGAYQIPANISNRKTVQRFINHFFNAAYTYDNRYTLSVSARSDASNLFGVTTNKRSVPLGSAGVSWNIHNEKFFNSNMFPYLRFRCTAGYTGNLDNNASASPTIQYAFITNPYGSTYATVGNPPNPFLRWEKVLMLNSGIDFHLKNRVITGSVDYFVKNARDLLGNLPAAPQSGFNILYRNGADLITKGVDVVLHSNNVRGALSWQTDFLFSYASDKVKKYTLSSIDAFSYFTLSTLLPVEGRPLYSIYSFPFAGLNNSGQPQGYFNGKTTTAYTDFLYAANDSNIVYNGPANPKFFGSLRNTLQWKNVEFSFNITYKLGYFFRRTSMDYIQFAFYNVAHPDYTLRWQQPGDELHTIVPVRQLPIDYARESFFTNSSALIEKGDHIRLQDIQLAYSISKEQYSRLPFSGIRFNVNINNVGILWRTNKQGIDPDAVPLNSTVIFPAARSIAAGFTIQF